MADAPSSVRVAGETSVTGASTASVFLGHAQNFLDGGEPRARFGPPVLTERDHPALHGGAPNLGGRRAPEDEAANVLGDDEQLVDADPALVARLSTRVTARAPIEFRSLAVRDSDGEEIGRVRLVGYPARLADPAQQPLGEDAAQDRGDQ